MPLKTVRSIEIEKFVPDRAPTTSRPASSSRPTTLSPRRSARRLYALLREVLAEQGLAAICKVVIKDREALAALNPYGDDHGPETLYWPDEIRATERAGPARARRSRSSRPSGRWRQQLIAAMTGELRPGRVPRRVPRGAEEVIEAKVQGQRDRRARGAARRGGQLVDLMAMLEASVNAARTARSNRETEEAAEEEVELGPGGGRGAGRWSRCRGAAGGDAPEEGGRPRRGGRGARGPGPQGRATEDGLIGVRSLVDRSTIRA